MRVYHFICKQYGIENIERRRMKVSQINTLNDPFELLGYSSADRELRKVFQNAKEKFASTFGVLCFSRSWQNPVQWSHYAERHHGLCLGFDVPDEDLTPVQYSRQRLKSETYLQLETHGEKTAQMRKMLATKFSHWRYEQEERAFCKLADVDRDADIYFMPFGERLRLKEVVVGAESSITRSELNGALGGLQSEVTAFKARLAFRSFRVVKQLNRKLWH